jgi:hypothetical protein
MIIDFILLVLDLKNCSFNENRMAMSSSNFDI